MTSFAARPATHVEVDLGCGVPVVLHRQASAGGTRSRSIPISTSTSIGGRISSIRWIPREGIDRQTYLETKFGSAERYDTIAERVAAAAAIEGLPLRADKITRQPNTLDCHRLILWSRSATDPARVKQRLMELYFAEGGDLSDPKTLIQAAIDCGMDGDLVRRLLASDADVDRIEGEANSAKEAGIDGVPSFIFGGSVIVTGAQSPEYLANAIRRVADNQARLRA